MHCWSSHLCADVIVDVVIDISAMCKHGNDAGHEFSGMDQRVCSTHDVYIHVLLLTFVVWIGFLPLLISRDMTASGRLTPQVEHVRSNQEVDGNITILPYERVRSRNTLICHRVIKVHIVMGTPHIVSNICVFKPVCCTIAKCG